MKKKVLTDLQINVIINLTNQYECYVLVKFEGNNYIIGRKEYDSKDDAIARQSELSELGINLHVMTLHEAVDA